MLQRIQSVLSSSGESQPVNFNREVKYLVFHFSILCSIFSFGMLRRFASIVYFLLFIPLC